MKNSIHTMKLKKDDNTFDRKDRILPLVFVYSVMIILMIVANIMKPGFLSAENVSNLLRQSAFLGLIAIGQTIVIITGGIDISIMNTVVFTNILSAQLMDGSNEGIPKTILVVLLVGLILGFVNGVGVHFFKVPPIIMTLATGNIMFGCAYIYCGGAPKGYSAPAISYIVNKSPFGGISWIAIIWLLASAAVIVLLKLTVFGRKLYAVGANRTASYYSGLGVSQTVISAYMISSVLAALTGMLLVGYTGTSYLSVGAGYNTSSIAAVVVGGTLITGGRGGYVGTIAGVLIMSSITSLMTMHNVAESGKQIAQGLIIIALLIFVYSSNRKKD